MALNLRGVDAAAGGISAPTRPSMVAAHAVCPAWRWWSSGVPREVRGLIAARRRQGGAAASHRHGEFLRSTRGAIRTYQGHRNEGTTAAWTYSSSDVLHPFRVRTNATTLTRSII